MEVLAWGEKVRKRVIRWTVLGIFLSSSTCRYYGGNWDRYETRLLVELDGPGTRRHTW